MRMLIDNKVPQNIVEHILIVNKVAVFLAKKLKEAGVDINVELVDTGSMLHDVAKPNKPHSSLGGEIVEKAGYPEVARLVRKHAFIATFDEGLTWEEKVVQYADKRCRDDKIVSVDERYDDFMKRYGDSSGRGEEARKVTKEREKEIFSKLKIKPEDLKELVK